jgi:hypothetical protein
MSSNGFHYRADSLTVLIDSLREIGGHFEPPTSLAPPEFVGNNAYFHRFEQFGETAALRLANCVDDISRTSTTYRGKSVILGYLCYTALRHLIYYEPPDTQVSGPGKWKGFLDEPDASQTAARQAKAAWLSVIQAKLYHFL